MSGPSEETMTLRIKNDAPEADLFIVEIEGHTVEISRDKAGTVYIGVNKPDGYHDDYILGESDPTPDKTAN